MDSQTGGVSDKARVVLQSAAGGEQNRPQKFYPEDPAKFLKTLVSGELHKVTEIASLKAKLIEVERKSSASSLGASQRSAAPPPYDPQATTQVINQARESKEPAVAEGMEIHQLEQQLEEAQDVIEGLKGTIVQEKVKRTEREVAVARQVGEF